MIFKNILTIFVKIFLKSKYDYNSYEINYLSVYRYFNYFIILVSFIFFILISKKLMEELKSKGYNVTDKFLITWHSV